MRSDKNLLGGVILLGVLLSAGVMAQKTMSTDMTKKVLSSRIMPQSTMSLLNITKQSEIKMQLSERLMLNPMQPTPLLQTGSHLLTATEVSPTTTIEDPGLLMPFSVPILLEGNLTESLAVSQLIATSRAAVISPSPVFRTHALHYSTEVLDLLLSSSISLLPTFLMTDANSKLLPTSYGNSIQVLQSSKVMMDIVMPYKSITQSDPSDTFVTEILDTTSLHGGYAEIFSTTTILSLEVVPTRTLAPLNSSSSAELLMPEISISVDNMSTRSLVERSGSYYRSSATFQPSVSVSISSTHRPLRASNIPEVGSESFFPTSSLPTPLYSVDIRELNASDVVYLAPSSGVPFQPVITASVAASIESVLLSSSLYQQISFLAPEMASINRALSAAQPSTQYRPLYMLLESTAVSYQLTIPTTATFGLRITAALTDFLTSQRMTQSFLPRPDTYLSVQHTAQPIHSINQTTVLPLSSTPGPHSTLLSSNILAKNINTLESTRELLSEAVTKKMTPSAAFVGVSSSNRTVAMSTTTFPYLTTSSVSSQVFPSTLHASTHSVILKSSSQSPLNILVSSQEHAQSSALMFRGVASPNVTPQTNINTFGSVKTATINTALPIPSSTQAETVPNTTSEEAKTSVSLAMDTPGPLIITPTSLLHSRNTMSVALGHNASSIPPTLSTLSGAMSNTNEFITSSRKSEKSRSTETTYHKSLSVSREPNIALTTSYGSSQNTAPSFATNTLPPPAVPSMSVMAVSTPPCSPVLEITPLPSSIVSIILAMTPSELSKIAEVGSVERCQLKEALVSVYKEGLKAQLEMDIVSERNTGQLVNNRVKGKRQAPLEPEYVALITGVTEANDIGENVVDVMFSILDISDLTSPQPIDSISVSEAYELANVYDIGGYTIVRAAQPAQNVEETTAASETGLSRGTRVAVIVSAVVLAALVVLGLLLTLMAIAWRKHHRGKLTFQRSSRQAQISLLNRTLVPTNSFVYESQLIVQQPDSSQVRTPHDDLPEALHETSETSSKSSKAGSVTTLGELAHPAHQEHNHGRTKPKSQENSEQVVTTITHLAHSVSSESVSNTQTGTAPKQPPLAEVFERVSHYNSPHISRRLPHHLPPLKPRFHHTPSLHSSQAPPDSPTKPPSPTLSSTFRRISTPVNVTPTKEDNSQDMVTPNSHPREGRRKKRKRRKKPTIRSENRPSDDRATLLEQPAQALMKEEQPAETPMTDEQHELWHRRRATMEYHRYLSGEESSFHPSFLSYKHQPPLVSTPAPPLVVMGGVTSSPTNLAAQEFPVETLTGEVGESESDSLILEEVEGSEVSYETSSDSRGEEDIEVTEVGEEAEHARPLEGGVGLKESRESQREQKRHNIVHRLFHRHKIAPLPQTTLGSSSSPYNVGADLAWMDTINGPQLMSVLPVQYSPLVQQPVSPHSVIRPPHLAPSPVHSHHLPSYHLPHTQYRTHSKTKQQHLAGREQSNGIVKENFRETDFVDGPDDATDGSREPEQSLTNTGAPQDRSTSTTGTSDEANQATHTTDQQHIATTTTQTQEHLSQPTIDTTTLTRNEVADQLNATNGEQETTTTTTAAQEQAESSITTAREQPDQSVVQRMIREAFNTPKSEKSVEDIDGRVDKRKKSVSRTSPQRSLSTAAIPVHVQPMYRAPHAGPYQIVLPVGMNQVWPTPVWSSHSYHHSQPHPSSFYHHLQVGGWSHHSPSYTSTPHYRTQRPKWH